MLRVLKFPVLTFTSSTATAVIWVAGSQAFNSFSELGRPRQLTLAASFEIS